MERYNILTDRIEILENNIDLALNNKSDICNLTIKNTQNGRSLFIIIPTQYFIDCKKRIDGIEKFFRDVIVHNMNFTMIDQLIAFVDFDNLHEKNTPIFDAAVQTFYIILELFKLFGHKTMTGYIREVCIK